MSPLPDRAALPEFRPQESPVRSICAASGRRPNRNKVWRVLVRRCWTFTVIITRGDPPSRVTNVKERETRLFETLLLASPDPILALDTHGRIMYANRAGGHLFPAATSELHEKDIAELGFLGSPEFQRNLTQVMNEQTACRGEFIQNFGVGQTRKGSSLSTGFSEYRSSPR